MSHTTDAKATGAPLGRNRDFVRLWTGGAVSGLGGAISSLAYSLLALSVTTSAALAGLLGLVALTVAALIRLPAGAVVDRVPLRRLLVGCDAVRLLTTAVLITVVVAGHLALWQLLTVAAINAVAAAVSEVARNVALRHLVPANHLPQAFALDEGRGHAISLLGQPAGGVLYGITPAAPLVADLASFGIAAALTATITQPMLPTSDPARPRLRSDLLTGLRFLWTEPFLRSTLLVAAGYQLVHGGVTFALVASLTRAGAAPASLGVLFAIAAVGGLLGALATPKVQSRLQLKSIVLLMGWTAVTAFAALIWIREPWIAGLLLGCIYFTSAPANAVLLTAQITRTPTHLQGRVMAASFFLAGLAAPLGPPTSGLLLDATGTTITFSVLAAATMLITLGVHLNNAMRTPANP